MGSYSTCVICGFGFRGQVDDWSSEYRAIYSSPRTAGVTGVGRYDGNAEFIAPSNPAKKWSDLDYEFPNEDVIPVMRQPTEEGRHGFLLHESCWLLLEEFFGPNKTPVSRLLRIFESLPFTITSHGGVCWSHDYGGLWTHDVVEHFPWEEWFSPPGVMTEVVECASKDPFNVPERSSYLASVTPYEQPIEWNPSKPARDCFSLLPWEVLENMATGLSTTDALTLRLASISFQPLLWSSAFWASRFKEGGERAFLFEKRGIGGTKNWLGTYRETSPAVWSPGLRNRRRIWNLIGSLSHIASMHLATNPASQTAITRDCVVVGGLAIDRLPDEPWQRFEEGCCVRGCQTVRVPEDLSKVAFSICTSGDRGYLTGMRFITADGSDTCAGFISLGNETTHDVNDLRGFRTAVGARGIRAVQIVHRNGKLSRWFGFPQGFPISDRVSEFHVIGYIRVGFDGYKMVQLGACELESAPGQSPPAASMTFRRAALWYPELPPAKLFLNEASFTGESPTSADYRPLFWVHFGGKGGCRLRHITGISMQYLNRLESIKFFYDGEAAESTAMLHCGNSSDTTPEFTLDGAGGERLAYVDVGIRRNETASRAYSFVRHGYIVSVEIKTNRGRSYAVGNASKQDLIHQMKVVEGTTITGLYSSKHAEFGMISLGIISETVDPDAVSTTKQGWNS